MSQKLPYSFHVDKILCFVTRNGQVIETDTNQRFLEDATLVGLITRVANWMKEIDGEVGTVEGDTYHIDNNDLTLYCHFESAHGALSVNDKSLIRRALKVSR